jgi:hypothetical protein
MAVLLLMPVPIFAGTIFGGGGTATTSDGGNTWRAGSWILTNDGSAGNWTLGNVTVVNGSAGNNSTVDFDITPVGGTAASGVQGSNYTIQGAMQVTASIGAPTTVTNTLTQLNTLNITNNGTQMPLGLVITSTAFSGGKPIFNFINSNNQFGNPSGGSMLNEPTATPLSGSSNPAAATYTLSIMLSFSPSSSWTANPSTPIHISFTGTN